jgi:histidinol-phosphate/aromatic aminotransferase/cobyric acid decarboxylase-like protein
MKGKAALLAGLSIGYVLGTRDGRERYEQIKAQANKAWHNPRVQKTAEQAQTKAQEVAKQAADTAQTKAQEAQTKVQEKVRGSSEDETAPPATPSPTSPAPDTVSASSSTQGPA